MHTIPTCHYATDFYPRMKLPVSKHNLSPKAQIGMHWTLTCNSIYDKKRRLKQQIYILNICVIFFFGFFFTFVLPACRGGLTPLGAPRHILVWGPLPQGAPSWGTGAD